MKTTAHLQIRLLLPLLQHKNQCSECKWVSRCNKTNGMDVVNFIDFENVERARKIVLMPFNLVSIIFRCLFHWLCENIQLFSRFLLLKSTIPRSITLDKCWDLKKKQTKQRVCYWFNRKYWKVHRWKKTSDFNTDNSKMSCHLHYTMHVDTTCTHTHSIERERDGILMSLWHSVFHLTCCTLLVN